MISDHPHAQLAKAVWEAVSAGDADALAVLCTEDLVLHASGRNALAGTFRGREAVLQHLASLGEHSDRLDSTLSDILVGEQRVAVLFHVDGEREGRALDMDHILIFRIENSRLAEVWLVPRDQHLADEFWS